MALCDRCVQRPAATLLDIRLCVICAGLLPEPQTDKWTSDLLADDPSDDPLGVT